MHQIDLFKKYPKEVQNDVFLQLIEQGKGTEWGEKYNFESIQTQQDFALQVPLTNYDTLKPYIDRLLKGEQNLLWNTDTKWFAKSSGTVNSKSKLIPVTKESLQDCHYKGGKDLLSLYYNQLPDRKLYKGKHLTVGGSTEINYLSPDSYFGDLSAIILKNMPWWAEIRRTPAKEIALMSKWEEKIEKLAHATIDEDVYILAGVPSWTLVLCNRVLEITGKSNLREVWPNLELFMHGGVSFEPYRAEFKRLIPFDDMHYLETYNASEGFFGIQDDLSNPSLLLMLDYGVFYEFIPMKDFKGVDSTNVIPLKDVVVDVNYAIVISTNAGLWRHIIGDTVVFHSTVPYRFTLSGRTKSFINAFGEEVIVENTDKAIRMACETHQVSIRDYTVAPKYMAAGKKGAHEWLIEFIQPPKHIHEFMHTIDSQLKILNSDYEAKRQSDLSLQAPIVHIMPKGSFDNWLKSKGKLGGQHKIPRLNNDRIILEEILAISGSK